MPAGVMVPFERQQPVEGIAGTWCACFESLELMELILSATLADAEGTEGNWNHE